MLWLHGSLTELSAGFHLAVLTVCNRSIYVCRFSASALVLVQLPSAACMHHSNGPAPGRVTLMIRVHTEPDRDSSFSVT